MLIFRLKIERFQPMTIRHGGVVGGGGDDGSTMTISGGGGPNSLVMAGGNVDPADGNIGGAAAFCDDFDGSTSANTASLN